MQSGPHAFDLCLGQVPAQCAEQGIPAAPLPLADQADVLFQRAAGDELGLLRELGQAMRDASICGLGQTASSAVESALRRPELLAS